MATTYTSLNAQIANELQRDDLTLRIPEFIDSAERRIARECRPRGFEVYVSSTFTAGSGGAIIDQPERLVTMISFHVLSNAAGTASGNIRTDVFRRAYSFVRFYGRDQTVMGLPKYFADMGQDQMIVAPSPAVAYPFEMGYYQRLAPLSVSNETNWLTENAPDLLLYASLLASAPFLKDDDRVPTWKEFYSDYAAALNATENVFETSDATTPRKNVGGR